MKKRGCRANCVRNDKKGLIATPQKAGVVMTNRGYTLIEVILAILVIAIAVSSTLVVMSKMMNYTIKRGQAVDICNAVTISQMAIDRVRDQRFPPTGIMGDLTTNDTNITLLNTVYTCNTRIEAFDGVFDTTTQYDIGTNTDALSDYSRNLLKVTVTVSKNGKPFLVTVTYKTRNGYY